MYIGIDIGKADFHCALLLEEKVATKSFPDQGCQRLFPVEAHPAAETLSRRGSCADLGGAVGPRQTLS